MRLHWLYRWQHAPSLLLGVVMIIKHCVVIRTVQDNRALNILYKLEGNKDQAMCQAIIRKDPFQPHSSATFGQQVAP